MGGSDGEASGGDRPRIPPAASAAYPVRSGNLVRPLVDGTPAFRRIGEAVEAARHSVWLTVAFFAHDFRFPEGRGGLFDVLDRAAGRGVDVRVLFWRPSPESSRYGRTFPGTPADHDGLAARGSRVLIRWDRASGASCQHQKSWLIDAGRSAETCFVGGVNLTARALGSPGHRDGGQHDLYVEVCGPSATDVHHNFVQRWNEASERARPNGAWPPGAGPTDLPFPARPSAPRGASAVQIQRMVSPGRYTDGTATPGGRPFAIAGGEASILEQYRGAIDAARRSIYIESQALPIPDVAARLEAALRRGVEVALLVPADPEEHVRAARRDPARAALFAGIEALGRHANFLLAGLIALGGDSRRSVYVHAKAMLVDDAWMTLGSCNLHAGSMSGHTEMNVAVWDAGVVVALRRDLLREHLDGEADSSDDRAALRRFGQVARANALQGWGAPGRRGLATALDPAAYGRDAPR